MTSTRNTLIKLPDEIDADWLSGVLGERSLTIDGVERIGTGQMSQSHRVRYRGDGGAGSVIVKLASDDPNSRAAGVGMGAYLREIAFYRNLATRIGGPLAHCHLAVYDDAEGWFTLVLADIADGTQGDQIAGCSVEEARAGLRCLAQVHAPVFNDLALSAAEYLNQPNPLNQALLTALLPGFLERYSDRIAPEHEAVCRAFVPVSDAWSADRRPPLGLVHGDYRLDNLLFTPSGCTVVDWQTMSWGPVMTDAAYLLGGGLSVPDRRAHETELIRSYYDELISLGVTNFSWDQCWAEYRRQTFWGLVMTIGAAMVVARTERGDDMFMAWLARNAQQILDLDALSLLPEPGAAPVALRPDPADEGRHVPGPEPLWNESWYFDGVSADGTLGVYVRLGRLPNSDSCVYTAAIVGPGRPSLMLVDYTAPLPPADDDSQQVQTAALHATQVCLEPLERFHVTVDGTADSHADQSAPLRGEAGDPVRIALDLTWTTDGVPYAWRQSTRYEIPCQVAGTVRVGDEQIEFSGPGQRDHSWGARDWWASDWMWSAFHLSDGTRTHAVTVPQLPGFGVGYVQRDGELAEIETGVTNQDVTADGLIASATITTGPAELELSVEPIAFGALRLQAPDGRVTHFPRAMARVRTADGRTGLGWIEWNRNQH